jgi:hypothetical protein
VRGGRFLCGLGGPIPLLVGSPKGKRASMHVSALPVGLKIGFGRVERTLYATSSRVQIGFGGARRDLIGIHHDRDLALVLANLLGGPFGALVGRPGFSGYPIQDLLMIRTVFFRVGPSPIQTRFFSAAAMRGSFAAPRKIQSTASRRAVHLEHTNTPRAPLFSVRAAVRNIFR